MTIQKYVAKKLKVPINAICIDGIEGNFVFYTYRGRARSGGGILGVSAEMLRQLTDEDAPVKK